MLRLLHIEFHKLIHNRASRNLTIIYFLLLTSIALMSLIKFNIGNVQFNLTEQGIFDFPYIWHFNTYVADFFKIFLLLVIVSMMANEYTYKTLKQNLIDGLSKKEFILSKFYTVITFAIISTVFVFFISLILGLMFSKFDEIGIIFSKLEYLIAFFIKLVGFFSFGLFLGILIKRSAFAVGTMFVWYLAEQFISWTLKLNFSDTKIASKISHLLPLEAMSNLIVEPATKLGNVQALTNQIGQEIYKDYSVTPLNILIVVVWIFIFIHLSYTLLKNRDL